MRPDYENPTTSMMKPPIASTVSAAYLARAHGGIVTMVSETK